MNSIEPLVIEGTYNAPINLVWKAITDSDAMKQWYFQIAEFKPVVGFEFQFEAGKDGRSYVHLCKVTEVITGNKIAYSWRYDGYPGNSMVTFELFEAGDETRLKLTHSGIESFRAKELDRENFAEGWTYIAGTSLKDFLEKLTV